MRITDGGSCPKFRPSLPFRRLPVTNEQLHRKSNNVGSDSISRDSTENRHVYTWLVES